MTEKAVETMLEKASELPEYSETTRPDTYFKSGFRLGYHQAEKDLELGWEDMFTIFSLVNEVLDDYADGKTKKEVGEEILRRFKDYKERKENGTK